MKRDDDEPKFEMRHRMSLSLEYGSVSINDIARELGLSRTTVSNYLHGRTQPRRSDLRVWAMRCGVPFDWLVGPDSTYELDEVDIKPAAVTKPAKPAKPVKPVKRTTRKETAKAI